MNYEEAKQESLKVKWKIDYCQEGEKCWCRTITTETPIIFNDKPEDDEFKDELYLASSGTLSKEIAEHIVNLQNNHIDKDSNKDKLIELLLGQIEQLTIISKIELGDDVIDEINKLKRLC